MTKKRKKKHPSGFVGIPDPDSPTLKLLLAGKGGGGHQGWGDVPGVSITNAVRSGILRAGGRDDPIRPQPGDPPRAGG